MKCPGPAGSPSREALDAARALIPAHCPRAGLGAVSEIAGALRRFEGEGRVEGAAVRELLAEVFIASWPELVARAHGRARRLSHEGAEEVVANVAARLDSLYAGWRGTGSFEAYLDRVLTREAWAVARREGDAAAPVREEGVPTMDAEADQPPAELQVRALLRFAWYLYGSPDNPERLEYENSFVDFIALKARLTRQPFAELVAMYQPRPGSWGEGDGEADRKWWRGRASLAQRRVQEALKEPPLRAVYLRILRELQGGDSRAGTRRRRTQSIGR